MATPTLGRVPASTMARSKKPPRGGDEEDGSILDAPTIQTYEDREPSVLEAPTVMPRGPHPRYGHAPEPERDGTTNPVPVAPPDQTELTSLPGTGGTDRSRSAPTLRPPSPAAPTRPAGVWGRSLPPVPPSPAPARRARPRAPEPDPETRPPSHPTPTPEARPPVFSPREVEPDPDDPEVLATAITASRRGVFAALKEALRWAVYGCFAGILTIVAVELAFGVDLGLTRTLRETVSGPPPMILEGPNAAPAE